MTFVKGRYPTHCRGCGREYDTEVTRFHYPSGRQGCWECRQAAKKANYEKWRLEYNERRRMRRKLDAAWREKQNAYRRTKRRKGRPRGSAVDVPGFRYTDADPDVALCRAEAARRGLRVA